MRTTAVVLALVLVFVIGPIVIVETTGSMAYAFVWNLVLGSLLRWGPWT